MRFKSIAMRIIVLVIPPIFVATLLFLVLSYNVADSRINKTMNDKMHESLLVADLEMQIELTKNAAIAMNFASYGKRYDFNEYDDEENNEILAEGILLNENTFGGGIWFEPYMFDNTQYYFGTYIYKSDSGETVYVPRYGEFVDYFSEDWYKKGKNSNGEIAWSKVYYDPVSTITMVTATKPIFNDVGKYIGCGTSDMNVENVQKIVSNIRIGETGRAFILGVSGEDVTFFDKTWRGNTFLQSNDNQVLSQLRAVMSENKSGSTSIEIDGTKYRVYYMTMNNVGWKLAAIVEEREISSSTFSSFLLTTIIPVCGLVLLMIGIVFVIGYLQKIISKVNNFADMASSGDFTKRIDVTEVDEFGIMEQRLNTMIENMSDMSENSANMLKLAEDASKSKSEFLSRMSHEIRTPMNAIIGMTQIARSSNDIERVHDCLSKVDTASKHLLALINDILDMSKIEANKLELENEEFNLYQLLSNIYDMMKVKADEKNQEFTLDIKERVPHSIISDELRFTQVMTNLIGNAVKFTQEGGSIKVSVTEIERSDDYTAIEICVKDNGIGMSQEQINRLFRHFEQGDGSVSRKYGGTGLGLAISKRLVEMMQGEVWVRSEIENGSEFGFRIKAKMGQTGIKSNLDQISDFDIKSLKILVVDDSAEASDYMKHVLNSMMFQCDNVYDGHQAIEAVNKAKENGMPYNIIFMDYMMPVLNGIEAARKIKQNTNDSATIIMVSAYDWKDIETEAINAGIRKHIMKPFSPSNVLNSINEAVPFVKNSFQNISLPKMDFNGNTILLVEDVDINREVVIAFFEDTGITIDIAENGEQAVKLFEDKPDKYDLILMDIQMPEMDGYEATRVIRKMNVTRAKTIPIIAMTANAMMEDVIRCLEEGMNDHIAKPIEPERLLTMVNDYLFMKDFLNNNIL